MATQYAKLPVTGERIFWVPNSEEVLKQHQTIKIPLSIKKQQRSPSTKEEAFFSHSSSSNSYASALQRCLNSTHVAITLENFPFSDIGSLDILKQISESWESEADPLLETINYYEWVQLLRSDGSHLTTNKAVIQFNKFPLSLFSYLETLP